MHGPEGKQNDSVDFVPVELEFAVGFSPSWSSSSSLHNSKNTIFSVGILQLLVRWVEIDRACKTSAV